MNPWVYKKKFTKLGEMLTQEFVGLMMTAVLEGIIRHRGSELAHTIGIKGKFTLAMEYEKFFITLTRKMAYEVRKITVTNGQN